MMQDVMVRLRNPKVYLPFTFKVLVLILCDRKVQGNADRCPPSETSDHACLVHEQANLALHSHIPNENMDNLLCWCDMVSIKSL